MYLDVLGNDFSRLTSKKLYLFDMDGTIYLENSLFNGVKELLSQIEKNGAKYVFITNNSSKSVKDYMKKLRGMGLSVNEDNFFTSAQATEMFLKEKFGNALIYAQGTKSFVKGLRKSRLNITTEYNEKAVAVVVGFDTELTSEKLRNTCKMLTHDVEYFATNPDWCCPVDFGYIPDCGSMCFGIEKATGKKPIYIGNPEPTMIQVVMSKFGVDKTETVVFGDRIYTDVASGINAGVDAVLVLSGEATMKDYDESEVKPTFVLNSINELL